MVRDRGRKSQRSRRENTRDERKIVQIRELLTFSFKYLDQTQPSRKCESIELWEEKKLLKALFSRVIDLSKLTREEAVQQQQIKIYGDFPPDNKTSFFHPKHVDQNVPWAAIEGIGGKPRIAGFISESTFYVIFLDSEHQFWHSDKKNT
ncbi:hypothetical protein [Endozoicomonas numazuensis]|nr:hypothetical protein [Endozoicomonas numazuensis]